MAIMVSPGINVSEVDLTTSIAAVSTTEAAIGGLFSWGPVGKVTLIDSENTLVSKYGPPTDDNYETFFSAANFLAYSDALYVSRAIESTGFSNTVVTSTTAGNTTVTIANTQTSISTGLGVYGDGIPENAIVTGVTTNTTHTIVALNIAPTETGTPSVNYFDRSLTFSAVANTSSAVDRPSYVIKNEDQIDTISIPAGIEFVAKYPGEFGNSLRVSVCSSVDQFGSVVDPYFISANSSVATNNSVIPGDSGITLNVNERTANVFISNSATLSFSNTYILAGEMKSKFAVGDYIEVGNNSIGKQMIKIKSISELANTNPLSPTGEVYFNLELEQPYKLATNFENTFIKRSWEFASAVAQAPGISDEVINVSRDVVDQMSVVVIDQGGKFTKSPGSVLEIFANVSRVQEAKLGDGTANYYKTVINNSSNYVWSVNDIPAVASGSALTVQPSGAENPYNEKFSGGQDGVTESTASMSSLASAYDIFKDNTSIDISLIITGKATGISGAQNVNYYVDNLAEVRQDCVVFASPPKNLVVTNGSNISPVDGIIEWRNVLRASSYLFLDSGYKYQYDKYNDVYRWVPLNGDMAGITARTDYSRDPWFSPAGFNRGQIKNLIKLAWNPNQADRDQLYKKDVNSVVSFPGQGTVLYGDKTALGKSSAFDRINVRRLFIILKKAISKASQQFLFEFNDEFTRAQFRNLVEPYLRDVQGRRGITDFRVVCDETNNTPEVIDTNRFVGDIYIRPARSINFIQLNLVAVKNGVEFSEIVGLTG